MKTYVDQIKSNLVFANITAKLEMLGGFAFLAIGLTLLVGGANLDGQREAYDKMLKNVEKLYADAADDD